MVALATPALAEIVNINLLQLNDIYEITPVEGELVAGWRVWRHYVNNFTTPTLVHTRC